MSMPTTPSRRAPRRGLVRTTVLFLALAATLLAQPGTADAARRRSVPPSDIPEAVTWAIIGTFPQEEWGHALAVSWCESNWQWDTPRVSGARRGSVGLFQINRVHKARAARLGYTWDEVRLDPIANARVAADLWKEAGWRPWTCRKAL